MIFSMEAEDKLKDQYPGLKQLEIANLDFGDDSEIHLLKIPTNVDPQLLLNIDFDIYEKGKIKIGEKEKYVIQPTLRKPNPTLIIADDSKVIHFKSDIIMSKYVKSKKDPQIFKSEEIVVPLPNNHKNRHPLFGSNFENKIELSKDIEKKLNDTLANFMKQDKKSKKKKKKEKEVEEDHTDEIIFSLLKTQSTSKEGKSDRGISSISTDGKKNKNSKKRTNEEPAQNIKNELFTEYETDNGSVSRSSKKIRKTRKSLIEESLRSIKSELFPENETDSSMMVSSSKKSKTTKKSMDRKSLSNIKTELFTEYETDSGVSPSKKKKHKKVNNGNCFTPSKQIKQETLDSSLQFDLESLISPTKKRKRTSSTFRSSDSEEDDVTASFSVSSIMTNKEKKSKKPKFNYISEDILNGIDGETSPSKKVKKKKNHKEVSE